MRLHQLSSHRHAARRAFAGRTKRAAASLAVDAIVLDPWRSARRRITALALATLTLWVLLGAGRALAQSGTSGGQVGIKTDPFAAQRHDMVDVQVRQRGVEEPHVLDAMEKVPRHLFVPQALESEAYLDRPVPIAPGQTLSQAYVSARMIALLELDGDERVLEVGTGSGYDAALLSRVAKEVYTIEIDEELAGQAKRKLRELGYSNVSVRTGDGYRGWPDKAPFDAILVTTAPQRIPEPLFEQLAPGGRMVIAVGYSLHQDLQVVTKGSEGEREVRRVSLISLAPMTGEVTETEGEGDSTSGYFR